MKHTLLIMTRNERECLPVMLPKVDESLFCQMIILDGSSTDGTTDWAMGQGYGVLNNVKPEFARSIGQKKLLYVAPPGFRHAYISVWPYITGDTVTYWTPDGNSPPEALPLLLAEMENDYDLVIGSRYIDEAKSEDDDVMTAFGNWIFRTAANQLFAQSDKLPKMTDPMVMLRSHRKNLPMEFGIDWRSRTVMERLLQVDVDWIPLMSARMLKRCCQNRYHYHKDSVVNISIRRQSCSSPHWKEIPVDEPARIAGKRKLKPWRWGMTYLMQYLQEWIG